MFRCEHTYELLITEHRLQVATVGQRPILANAIIVHGIHGSLEIDLWGEEHELRGLVAPLFYKRNGEPLIVPETFVEATRRLTAGVSCVRCKHTHLSNKLRGNSMAKMDPVLKGGVE
jgi:hypothetical protein